MFIDTRRSSLVTAFNRLTIHRHAGMAWLLGAALLCPIRGLAEGTRFDFPPQALGTALDRVAKEAGLQILYSPEAVKGLSTRGLEGEFTPRQAIERLLEGTGLKHVFLKGNTVTVNKPLAANDAIRADAAEKKKSSGEATELPEMTVTAKPTDNTSYNVFDATTATKTDTPIMETPVSIQVVPQQVFRDQQDFTLKEALKNVSGLRIDSIPSLGVSLFRLRGFESGAVFRNLLAANVTDVDGELVNVERVEVLKGPASILYGRVEPGGLINIVTRQPRAVPYYALQQQFGSFDLYRTTAEATGPLTEDGSVRYALDFAYQTRHTFRDFESRDNLLIAPVLSWTISPKSELILDFEYFDSTVTPASGIPAIGNRPAPLPFSRNLIDPISEANDANWLVGARLSHAFTPDWKLALRFATAQQTTDRQILVPFGFNADNPNLLDRFFLNSPDLSFTTYSTNLDLTGRFATGSLTHRILLGVDYQRSGFTEDETIVAGAPPIDINHPVYLRPDFFDGLPSNQFLTDASDQYGLYFQDDIVLWEKLHLLGGGRYDWASTAFGFSEVSLAAAEANVNATEVTDEAFSPRVGLLYQPRPWLSLYGHYAESFGLNNGRPAPDKPPLPPETGTEYEVGVKTSFFDDALTGTLAFFDLTKQNVLTADLSTPDPSDRRPVGEQRSRGIELDISGQVSEGLSLIASYAYTDPEVTDDQVQLEDGTVTPGNTGNRFIDTPRHAGSVWATYGFQRAPLQGLKLGGGLFAVGQREGDLENTFQLPGYVRVDAFAAYEWKVGPSKVTAQLNVENLLDKDYFEGADSDIGGSAVPGAPLTVIGSLRVEF